MFAYAIWDARAAKLCWFATVSAKSLFITRSRRGLLFRQRTEVPAGRRRATRKWIRKRSGFTCSSATCPTRGAPFAGIRSSLPAPLADARSCRRQLETGAYWSSAAPARTSRRAYPKRKAATNPAAVRRIGARAHDRRRAARRVPERRHRFQPRGGFDGAAVRQPVRTFSMGFEDRTSTSCPTPGWSPNRHRASGTNREARRGDLVPRLIRTLTSPSRTPPAIPTYLVSQFAARA